MRFCDFRLFFRISIIIVCIFGVRFVGATDSVRETIPCREILNDAETMSQFIAGLRKEIKRFSQFNEAFRPFVWGALGTQVFSDSLLPSYKKEAVYEVLVENVGKDQADIIAGQDVGVYKDENVINFSLYRQVLRYIGLKDPNLESVPLADIDLIVASYLRLKKSEPSNDVTRSRLALIWAGISYNQYPWFQEMIHQVGEKIVALSVEKSGFLKNSKDLSRELTMNHSYWLRRKMTSSNSEIPSRNEWEENVAYEARQSLQSDNREYSDFKKIREIEDFLVTLRAVKDRMDTLINSIVFVEPADNSISSSSLPVVNGVTSQEASSEVTKLSMEASTSVHAMNLEDLRRNFDNAQSLLSPLVQSLVKSDAKRALPTDTKIEPKDLESLLRFHGFFDKLKKSFLERDRFIDALKLVFINRGSMLLLGYTGTGKSEVADAVGENILDRDTGKNSYFSLQLTQETTTSETMGGTIVEEAMKGRMIRNYEQSVLGSAIVFLDEFFDGRLKFIRHFLKAFNERKHTQGPSENTFHGKTRVFLAASNLYLNQIYEAFGNNTPQALIDRFSIVTYFPGSFSDMQSIILLAQRKKFEPDSSLFLDELDQINEKIRAVGLSPAIIMRVHYFYEAMKKKVMAHRNTAVAEYSSKRHRNVQPPYQSTRIFSPRTLRFSFDWVRSYALLNRSLYSDFLELEVTDQDVEQALDFFYRLQGPSEDFLERLSNIPDRDPYEASQQDTVFFELKAYREVADELRDEKIKLETQLRNILEDLPQESEDQENAGYATLSGFVTSLAYTLADFDHPEKIDAKKMAALDVMRQLMSDENAARIFKR